MKAYKKNSTGNGTLNMNQKETLNKMQQKKNPKNLRESERERERPHSMNMPMNRSSFD